MRCEADMKEDKMKRRFLAFQYAGISAAVQCKGKWENNERKSAGNTGRSGRKPEFIYRKIHQNDAGQKMIQKS